MMDNKRVNTAVKIKLRIDRMDHSQTSGRLIELRRDIKRLVIGMTPEEFNEYHKRVNQ